MKRIITIIVFILAVGNLTNIIAQTPSNDGIRGRSAELERVRRQATQESIIQRNDGTKIDLVKVKKNFEGIQKLQDSIVKAYTQGEKIDFLKINRSSAKINKMAVSLKADLFSAQKNKTDLKLFFSEKSNVKDIIIDLDNAIRRFVTSPIFQDLKVIYTEIYEKSLSDLEEIIDLSSALRFESNKLMTK